MNPWHDGYWNDLWMVNATPWERLYMDHIPSKIRQERGVGELAGAVILGLYASPAVVLAASIQRAELPA